MQAKTRIATVLLVLFLVVSVFGELFSVVPRVYANPDTETLRPNAAGDLTQLTAVGTTPNWNCTDEATSDSDTTYVRSSTTDDLPYTDLYNIPDTAIPSGSTINQVTVYILARATSVTYKGAAYVTLKTEGTTWYGTANGPSTTYTLYHWHWLTNPTTTLAWSITEINALQIGVKMYSGYRDDPEAWYQERCTQVYVEVDWTAASSAINLTVTLYGSTSAYGSSSLSKATSTSLSGLVNVYSSSEFGKSLFGSCSGLVNVYGTSLTGFDKFFSSSSLLNVFGVAYFSLAKTFSSSSLLTVFGSSSFGKSLFFVQTGLVSVIENDSFSLSLQSLVSALLTVYSSVAYVAELMINVLSTTRFDLISGYGSVEFGKSLFFGQTSLVSFVSNLQGIWSLNYIANALITVYGSIAFATEFLVNVLTTTKFDSLSGYASVEFAKSLYFGQTGLVSFISSLQGSWSLSYLAGALLTIYSSVAYATSLAVNTLSTFRFDQLGFYGSVWFAKSVVFQQSSWIAFVSSVSSAFELLWISVISVASGLVVPSGVAWLVVPTEVTRFWFAVAAFFIGATTLGGALLVLSRKEKSRI